MRMAPKSNVREFYRSRGSVVCACDVPQSRKAGKCGPNFGCWIRRVA